MSDKGREELAGQLGALLPFMVVDGLTGEIKAVNDLCRETLGYTEDELVGWPLDVVIPGISRATHKRERAEYMKAPVAREMGPDREVSILCKDSTELRVWIGLAPVTPPLVVCAVLRAPR